MATRTKEKPPQIKQLLLEERRRIAEELHSGAAQSLSNALFLLNLFEKSGKKMELDEARESIQFAIHDIRYAIQELRQETSWPFLPSLHDLINTFKEKRRMSIEFHVEGNEIELSSDIRHFVLTLVREGLNNIAKHARATASRVVLRFKTSELEIWIEDNGSGIEPSLDLDRTFHFGLKFLRERAAQLQGDLTFESIEGKGAKLHVIIPNGNR